MTLRFVSLAVSSDSPQSIFKYANRRRSLLFLCQGLVGVEGSESPQGPDGEDVSVGVVVDGTRLVEHPRDILLQQKHLGRVENERTVGRTSPRLVSRHGLSLQKV